jgi:hypothetical protein
MSFPYVYRLRRPLYSYSEDGENTDPDKLRGLLRYTPFREAKTKEPSCLFVFMQKDRDHANNLYLTLRNGIARFPGCKQLTGISLERDNVEAVRVPEKSEKDQAQAFFDSIEDRLTSRAEKPDFAFVLHSRQPKPYLQDPYDWAKAALTKHSIPSQYVSWELLDSPNQFRYAISNIALSFFVKLGGVPWSISLEKKAPTLVVGIGRAETEDPTSRTRRRLTGYAICILSNGLYLDTSFFPPAETHNQFLIHLVQGLREALNKLLDSHKDVEKVTIHVSRFERRETIQAVKRVIWEYEQTQQIPIPFEVVRLTEDSSFSVFDLSHPGYVSEEGTIVALGRSHALIVTEGRREKAVWRGRKPVTLEIHREYCSSPSLQIRDTIEDAFHLSSVNWRGFNVITQPISLQYAKLLAQQVAKMSHVEPDICSHIQEHEGFNAIPWFI